MYKQIFDKSDGSPKLIESDIFDKKHFTDVQPPNGLYQPVHFDGDKWIGTPYEEWASNQFKSEEVEVIPDEKDEIIATLSIQLLQTETKISSIQEDIANLTRHIFEGE
ncbi:hypothetical protein K1Y23_05415 [Mammaliicoccus sciuri]|uniref:hypothetical protein n=1 Tax=Mammaliicoccus sciuri TaxID=1296 RepID=UPI001E2BC4B2|nr:hypothetical protein [Mammaliicoccus sciuri]MCD8798705.1 hypothetical protein [Mammaliicoccus sciuri]